MLENKKSSGIRDRELSSVCSMIASEPGNRIAQALMRSQAHKGPRLRGYLCTMNLLSMCWRCRSSQAVGSRVGFVEMPMRVEGLQYYGYLCIARMLFLIEASGVRLRDLSCNSVQWYRQFWWLRISWSWILVGQYREGRARVFVH